MIELHFRVAAVKRRTGISACRTTRHISEFPRSSWGCAGCTPTVGVHRGQIIIAFKFDAVAVVPSPDVLESRGSDL